MNCRATPMAAPRNAEGAFIFTGNKSISFAKEEQQWSAKQSKLQMLRLLKQIGKFMQEKVLTTDVAGTSRVILCFAVSVFVFF